MERIYIQELLRKFSEQEQQLILEIATFYAQHLGKAWSAETIDYIVSAFEGNHLRFERKNGIIVYVLEHHILDAQMLDYVQKTQNVVFGLNPELGSILYLGHVASEMGFKETVRTTRKHISSVRGLYPKIERVSGNRAARNWEYHEAGIGRK